jgi:hypothetical protein
MTNNNDKINIPMTIQQCYEYFFQFNYTQLIDDYIELKDYKIYSNFVQYGYILRRCNEMKATTNRDVENNSIEINHNKPTLPLINPNDESLNLNEISNKLDIIPSITLDDLKNRIKTKCLGKSINFHPLFDVYQPNNNFKKSQPDKPPIYRVFTQTRTNNNELKVPNLNDFIRNSFNFYNLYSFVNHSDVCFYNFNSNITLPNLYIN